MTSEKLLAGRKVGVAVTGSVAIYKTIELIRLLTKSGADVRVVMSKSAQKFVAPLMFESITEHIVLTDDNESWAKEIDSKMLNHISLAKWAEVFVLAPATANTIAKLANGIADNLLTQTLLAHVGKKIIAPAANTAMIEHPITKANLKMLSLCDYEIVEPIIKVLACKDEGKGAMAESIDIFWHCARALLKDEFYEHRNVVVTGGGSKEKIDDVRFVGNFSSGKMANSLALALYCKGANVTLITSEKSNSLPSQIYTVEVSSGYEFQKEIEGAIEVSKRSITTKPTLMQPGNVMSISKEPILFMAAAIADYKPESKVDGKLKKESIGQNFDLNMTKTDDILESIQKGGIKVVGFKAEYDEENAKTSAEKMLKTKALSAVCLNLLTKNGFGSDNNEVVFISDSEQTLIPNGKKLDIAFQIGELTKKL